MTNINKNTSEWTMQCLSNFHIQTETDASEPSNKLLDAYQLFTNGLLHFINDKNKCANLVSNFGERSEEDKQKCDCYKYAVHDLFSIDCHHIDEVTDEDLKKIETNLWIDNFVEKITSTKQRLFRERICRDLSRHLNMFNRQLIYMLRRRRGNDLREISEGMYQELFVSFARIFGLNIVSGSNVEPYSLNINDTDIVAIPDGLICHPTDLKEDKICAVIKVKGYREDECSDMRSTNNACYAPHIDSSLKGQLGGQFICTLPFSVFRNHGMYGFLVQGTNVTLTSFKPEDGYYTNLCNGNLQNKGANISRKTILSFIEHLHVLASIQQFDCNEFSSINDTVYVGTGESVVLFCNVTPNSYPRWSVPGVNKGDFYLYSVGLSINLGLQNSRKLEIMANIIEGNATKEYKIHGADTGILHGTEYHSLVLNCSVMSGMPQEPIMWFNESFLLGIGGTDTFELNIIPQKYDHGKIYTCIVNSSVLMSTIHEKVQLDIKYKPFITFNQGQHLIRVNETQSLTLSCIVDSNPVASKIVLEKNTKLFNVSKRNSTLTLDVFNISRHDSGTYLCFAENSIGESYMKTEIIVQYPPSIKIKTDLDKKVLQCIPNGEPNTYRFYPWIHLSDHGDVIRYLNSTETIHLQTNGATLNLYQYNGIYVCRVENGVSYLNRTVIQSGQVFVRQHDKPVFVSRNEHTQYGITGTEIDIKVFVYSYPFFHQLKVKTRGFLSIEYNKIDIENATVFDKIYSNEFRMNGFKITLHGFIIEANDFTSYTFWIENSVGDANFTVDLIDVEKLSGRTLNIYTQISSSFIGGLLLGIACTIFWNCVRKQRRKYVQQQVHQEVHYDEVELVDQNLVLNQQQTYHPVDTDNMINQDPNSGNSSNHNTSESNSSEAMSSRPLSVASDHHDYENFINN
ncbi:unnamed protein product [Mytilus edulis]|uniref:Ig-like domain-containing protein n=1 Tax=Mytilus edulis TaxID=6550 RepID=A0A8S3Q921_MYTED|nr:unnamed protein product [Mytilus edulis]